MSDRDEWRADVYAMTEAERQTNCGHTGRTGKACPHCGEEIT